MKVNGFKKIALIFFALSLLTVLAFFITLKHQLSKPLTLAQDKLFTIEAGTSFYHLTKQMVSEGIIDSRFWIRAHARLNSQAASIKAGTYRLVPGDTVITSLEKFNQGKEYLFSVTFAEGTTLRQWFAQLSSLEHISHQLRGKSYQENVDLLVKELELDYPNPEGWFYPETYSYAKGASDIAIMRQAHMAMKKVLDEVWQQRFPDLPYEQPYQALIMASIIEKESGKHAEHGKISSVFVNRLEKGMRLQTDPTIIYGLGTRYKGDITRKHKFEKTAYNTYRIDGLPPTPIAMPGKPALLASVQPDTTDYFYFVSNGQGSHIFSTNLKDHNRAVVKYQLK